MSWLGPASGIEAASAGHDVVMATSTNCYFCYAQDLPDDCHAKLPPGVVGNVVPLEKVYEFDPCAGVPLTARSHILGGQAFVWTEQIPNERWMEWQVWPRALAMSEVLWSGKNCRTYEDFKCDADHLVSKMRAAGVNAASPAFCRENPLER